MTTMQVTIPPIPGMRITGKDGLLTPAWQAWFYQLEGYLSKVKSGNGLPNGAVTGNIGDIYLNTAGGVSTTLYVKESGAGTNSGWVGK